jgi:hypothetical protein
MSADERRVRVGWDGIVWEDSLGKKGLETEEVYIRPTFHIPPPGQLTLLDRAGPI